MSNQFVLLQCDTPSPLTGRIYPREEIEKAIEKYQEQIDKDVAVGTMGEMRDKIEIGNISHKVTKLTINDERQIIADIELLNTPMGQIAQELIDTHTLRLSPCIVGQISEENMVVSDCTILHTTLVEKEE